MLQCAFENVNAFQIKLILFIQLASFFNLKQNNQGRPVNTNNNKAITGLSPKRRVLCSTQNNTPYNNPSYNGFK